MQRDLELQMLHDLSVQLRRDGVSVTVNYQTPPVGSTNNLWTAGVPQTMNIRALMHVVSHLDFRDNLLSNVSAGKTIFYIPYSTAMNDVKNVRVVFNNRIFDIDKVIQDKQLSNGTFLYTMLIQK